MHDDRTEVPYGYCHCGCGERTNLMPANRPNEGWVKGEPFRFLRGHHVKLRYPVPQYVEDENGCWVWQRVRDRHGYGRTHRESGKTALAHRVYYERLVGPIPDGLQLDHLCRNHACVNPEHLEPVTNRENVIRGIEARKREKAAQVVPPELSL